MAQLVVITGPSGVGKGTLITRLLEAVPGLEMSVSATTRPSRAGEVDGVAYHFLSRSDFEARRAAGEFLESAEYAGNLYGTLLSEIEGRPEEVRGVVLEIEVLGAQQVRASHPESVLVFIAPPDPATLRQRLVSRGTDSPEQIELRLAQASRELEAADEFDTVIVNDDLGTAAALLAEAVEGRLD